MKLLVSALSCLNFVVLIRVNVNAEPPVIEYEMKKIEHYLRKNTRMRQLGITRLVNIVAGRTVEEPGPEKDEHNDDPNFECNGQDDVVSEGNLSDDSLVPEAEALENMKSGHGYLKNKVLHFSIQ